MGKLKKALILLTLSLVMVGQGTTVRAVDLSEVYVGDYDVNKPISWAQSAPPYSQEYFEWCDGTFGGCACGVHTLAYLFIKTGYWSMGKDAMDAYKLTKEKGVGRNHEMSGMPSYDFHLMTSITDGKVKYLENAEFGNATSSHDYIREQYKKGHFMTLSVEVSGTGHLIAIDYVDDEGNIVILDSAIRAKYLNAMDRGGWVRNVHTYKVDGLKAQDAPKFWEGESGSAQSGSDSDSDSNNGGAFPELNDQWKTPLVEYEEDAVDTKVKGLNQVDPGFMGWLFR